jgi:hypothetical protein
MAQIRITDDELRVELTTREKIAGLHGDIRVPVTAVQDVQIEQDALAAARGLRAPGLAIPGRTKIGTWRGRGSRTFVVARRGVPAVRVTLRGVKPDELLVSTDDADAVARSVRTHAGLTATT